MTGALPARARSDSRAAAAAGRNFNLDVVRATAITVVVLAHAAVMSPVRHPLALTLAWIGQFGVDLFFVLSGWLIGGLFWREWQQTGTVRWPRFFLRRALRTVPPYLVVLPIAWLAVRLFAPERAQFSVGYLLFLQNYYAKIPFFAVSWSLCIEEHFYLFLPALVLLVLRFRAGVPLLFTTLLLLSPLCRTLAESTATIDEFDRSVLATHLRLEGLILGFWAAYTHACRPAVWTLLARWFPRLVWPALAFLACSPFVPGRLFYAAGLTGVAFAFVVVVGLAAHSAAWRLPAPGAIRRLAGMSYSIYLTHSLVIHVARNVAFRGSGASEVIYWPLVLAGMLGVGYVFSALVERTSLQLRERLLPARA